MGTRRTNQREHLLKPSHIICMIIGYVLGYCQQKYEFAIHCFVAMSNHYHLALTDNSNKSHSELSNFMRDFNSLVAHAVNVVRGRTGNLWSAGAIETFNFVDSLRFEDMFRRMVYMLLNPVAAGLVHTFSKWPGLVLTPGPTGYKEYEFKRPPIFFSKNMPESVTVIVTAPKSELAPEEYMKQLMKCVREEEREIQKEMKIQGKTFLGRKRILKQSAETRSTSEEPYRGIRPQIAAIDRQWRIQLIQDKRAFLTEYERCRDAFKGGDREVEFPFGTFKLVAYYGAKSRAGPDPPN